MNLEKNNSYKKIYESYVKFFVWKMITSIYHIMQYLLKIIVKYKSKPFSSSKDKSLLNIINEKTDEQ